MVAAKMGSAELVQALLAAGAKPALKNAHGDTAAAFAKRGGHEAAVSLRPRHQPPHPPLPPPSLPAIASAPGPTPAPASASASPHPPQVKLLPAEKAASSMSGMFASAKSFARSAAKTAEEAAVLAKQKADAAMQKAKERADNLGTAQEVAGAC